MNPNQLLIITAASSLIFSLVLPSYSQNGSFSNVSVSGTVTAGKIVGGAASTATGNQANAIGDYANASGEKSLALSNSGALGYLSISLGGYAQGYQSWVLGNAYTAPQAIQSTSIGWGASTALSSSTAIGFLASAKGVGSSAFGGFTWAQGAYQTATGCWNIPKGSVDGYPGATDPVFIVGNGFVFDENASPSNALEIYWNGNAWLQGTLSTNGVRTPPRGDLSMGSFTSGPQP